MLSSSGKAVYCEDPGHRECFLEFTHYHARDCTTKPGNVTVISYCQNQKEITDSCHSQEHHHEFKIEEVKQALENFTAGLKESAKSGSRGGPGGGEA